MKTKVPFAGRSLLLCVIIILISSSIAYRLVELQVIDSKDHSSIAADELIDKETIPAQRGIIMDRHETILTNNIQNAELVADRYHLREITVVVDGLAYNQAVHSKEWNEYNDGRPITADDDELKVKQHRRNVVRKYRTKLLENAERRVTAEEKAKLKASIDTSDARSNRLLNYDPEVCAYYFRLHDQLIADVICSQLNPVPEFTEQKLSIPEPTGGSNNKKGNKSRASLPPVLRERSITPQEIVDKIAQPDVAAHNAEAAKTGAEPRKYVNRIILANNLSFDMADKIREALKAAHIRGVMVQSSLRRSYSSPAQLCHVLGYVNHENKGMSGVEAYFHSYLNGVNGMREYRHNARGQVLANADDRNMAPKHGLNLRLTIDMDIQHIVEEELDAGMRRFRAERGCMIVVDPKTGDILAMVSRPAFNLNTKELITHKGVFPRGSVKDSQGNIVTGDFNFACQTRYEPGSTFKVIAVTAALDKKLLNIHSYVNCSPFSVGYGSKPINDRPYNYGSLPVWGVLAKSSNPGAANIALRAKWPNYKSYVEKFGLDKPVGIDLPSGGACLIADGSNIVNFSRIAYGYSVAVSPLHMAMVYATIANDGVRMKPRLIDRIIAADGTVYSECTPEEGVRVMSSKTAADLRFALETVTRGAKENGNPVRRGTATAAAIPGFRIGGKTGTAKKVKDGGGYYDNLYTVSFAGVLPIDDPKLVVMTVIDEPHPTDCNPGGGTVAAPIFRAAAERMIKTLNITPSNPEAYEKYLAEKAEGTASNTRP